MSDIPAAPTLERILDRCRETGLRRTRALHLMLEEMIRQGKPVTLAELNESPSLQGKADPATVYRLLMRLEENGILRRLGLHDRSSHYTIRYPDRHDDYLICKNCGSIEELDMACPVEKLEAEIEKASGYRDLDHELEFFGVCPACATA